MEYTTLGRTGLRVSVAGLGCGGFSRLGLSTGGTEASAIGIIHAALDQGVNLLDTASVYGTESVVGKAIKRVPRDQMVIATKTTVFRGSDAWGPRDRVRPAAYPRDAPPPQTTGAMVQTRRWNGCPPAGRKW